MATIAPAPAPAPANSPLPPNAPPPASALSLIVSILSFFSFFFTMTIFSFFKSQIHFDFLWIPTPNLLKSFFQCHLLSLFFILHVAISEMISTAPFVLQCLLNIELPTWYIAICIPIMEHLAKTIMVSVITAIIGCLILEGTIRGFKLEVWSTRAAIGYHVGAALFNHALIKPNQTIEGWKALISIFAASIGTVVLYLRDKEDSNNPRTTFRKLPAEIWAHVSRPYNYTRFLGLCFTMLLFKAGSQGFTERIKRSLEFGGCEGIDVQLLYHTLGPLLAELVAALLSVKYKAKERPALALMFSSSVFILSFGGFIWSVGSENIIVSKEVERYITSSLMIIMGISVNASVSLLKQAASTDPRNGKQNAAAIIIVDMFGAAAGALLGFHISAIYEWFTVIIFIAFCLICALGVLVQLMFFN